MDHRTARAHTRARLAALTRAAYAAGEGVLPGDLPGDAADEHEEHSPDRRSAGERSADGAPPGRGGSSSDASPRLDDVLELAPAGRRLSAGGARDRPPRHGSGSPGRWRVSLTPRAATGLVLAVVLLAGILALRALAADGGVVVPEARDAGETAGGQRSATPVLPAEPGDALASVSPAAEPVEPTTVSGAVVVHVAGQVASPGVVELPAGARVQDAVDAAGGALPEADLAAVNLARVLADGEQVYLPAPGEVPPPVASGPGGAPGGPPPGAGGSGPDPPAGLVNVNTADLATLDTLPGVGPAIAQRILDWRAEHGPFMSVEELTEVSGIGPATLERLRPLVTV